MNHTAYFRIAYSHMHNQEKCGLVKHTDFYGLVHKTKGWPGRTNTYQGCLAATQTHHFLS